MDYPCYIFIVGFLFTVVGIVLLMISNNKSPKKYNYLMPYGAGSLALGIFLIIIYFWAYDGACPLTFMQ